MAVTTVSSLSESFAAAGDKLGIEEMKEEGDEMITS